VKEYVDPCELELLCFDLIKPRQPKGHYSTSELDTQALVTRTITQAITELKEEGCVGVSDMVQPYYREEHWTEYFMCDIVLPSLNTVIEINGMDHFYPFTRQQNNFT